VVARRYDPHSAVHAFASLAVAAAAVTIATLKAAVSIPQLILAFLIAGTMTAISACTFAPEPLVRASARMLIRFTYRLRKQGLENIPAHGPAVIVCNHVSFVDAVIIMAACRRPVRFVMEYGIYSIPVLNGLLKSARVIPIAPSKENPHLTRQALEEVDLALRSGEIVAIFPEGGLTETGELNPFRPGVKRILERTPVPVVPMAVRGLWGSFFSRKYGEPMTRPFRRGMYSKVGLAVGQPIAPEAASLETLAQAVRELRGEWK
jgi:1-acyl-sn-glycerol-3-phosphate acyltransferase